MFKTKKEPKIYERDNYNVLDSSKVFLLVLVVPLLAAFCYILIISVLASLSGSSLLEVENSWLYIMGSILITHASYIGIYFWYNRRKKINYVVASNIKKDINWGAILVTVAMSLTAIFFISPIINLINYGLSNIGYNPDGSLPIDINSPGNFISGIIFIALIPAVAEELIMRGVIARGLQSKWKPWTAIILSALFFMLVHGSLQQTVFQFILGVVLAFVAYKGMNIIYPIVLHFINNLTVIVFAYVASGQEASPVTYVKAMDYISPMLYFIAGLGILVGLGFLFSYIMKQDKGLIKESIKTKQSQAKTDSAIGETSKGALTKNEKLIFYLAMGIGAVLWIVNTLITFLK